MFQNQWPLILHSAFSIQAINSLVLYPFFYFVLFFQLKLKPMHYRIAMAMRNSWYQLAHVFWGLIFIKILLFNNFFEQFASSQQFWDDIKPFLIPKVFIDLENIGVIQFFDNIDFIHQGLPILNITCIPCHYFNRANMPSLFMNRLSTLAKGSFSNWRSQHAINISHLYSWFRMN